MPRFVASAGSCLCFLLLLAVGARCQAQSGLSIEVGIVTADEQRLERALATRGSIEVVDMPLREVVALLSDRFQVNIVLARKKLEEAAVSDEALVTARLQDLPLESILRLILNELELGFTVRNNLIVVTTYDDLNSPDNLPTRVYPVRDLVGQSDGSEDYDALIALIMSTIDAVSWDEVGGPGSISELDNAGVLAVTQTWAIHRKIEHLLTTLRRAKASQSLAPVGMRNVSPKRSSSRSAAPSPRRYSAAAAQSWQVPQVHVDE